VPGPLHGVVSFQLVPVHVDRVYPLEDGDLFPEGDGCCEGDAGILDGEGAGDVDKLLEGLYHWWSNVVKDSGPWLIADELSIWVIEEGIASVVDDGLLDDSRVDGVWGAGADEVGMSHVAVDLMGEDEGALDQEGDTVVTVVVEVVIVSGAVRPVKVGSMSSDVGGSEVYLGALSGSASVHSRV
jgi:hypothetical protein